MKKTDRLPYEGLSGDYIYERMRIRLKGDTAADFHVPENVQMGGRYYVRTSDDAKEIVEQTGGAFWSAVSKIAFPFKEQIKKIPGLGPMAVSIKEKLLARALTGKDLSGLLNLDVNEFIRMCYREMLGREVDEDAFQYYQTKLCCGMPREGLICLLGRSGEFAERFVILNFSSYQKRYRKYQIKNKIKQIPILSHICYFLSLPYTMRRIHMEYGKSCADLRDVSSIYLQRINSLHQEIWAIQEQNISFKMQLDDLHQEVSIFQKQQQVILTLQAHLRKLNVQTQALHQKSEYHDQRIACISSSLDTVSSSLESCTEKLSVLDNIKNQLCSIAEEKTQISTQLNSLESALIQLGDISVKYTGEPLPDVVINNGILGYASYLEQIGVSKEVVKPTMDAFYEYVAELFRGDPTALKKHMDIYIPYIKEAVRNTGDKIFLDLGCGKGEFLAQLQENGVPAIGVDSNPESAQIGISLGRNISVCDGQAYLEHQETNGLAGISMFQVAEHMDFEKLFSIGKEMGRTVAPGGYVFIETINAWCYGRLGSFHMDPSHNAFPSQDGIKLMLEMCGFTDIKVLYYAPSRREAVRNEAIETCYEGFCVIGKKAALNI